jgi:hypothetical protein
MCDMRGRERGATAGKQQHAVWASALVQNRKTPELLAAILPGTENELTLGLGTEAEYDLWCMPHNRPRPMYRQLTRTAPYSHLITKYFALFSN